MTLGLMLSLDAWRVLTPVETRRVYKDVVLIFPSVFVHLDRVLSSQTRVFCSSIRPTACRAILSTVNPGNRLLVSTPSRTSSTVCKPASRPGARSRRLWTTVNPRQTANRYGPPRASLRPSSSANSRPAQAPVFEDFGSRSTPGNGSSIRTSSHFTPPAVLSDSRPVQACVCEDFGLWHYAHLGQHPQQMASRPRHPRSSPSSVLSDSRPAQARVRGDFGLWHYADIRSTTSANGFSSSTPARSFNLLLATNGTQ
ncbi:hypothetical protein B0H15DRAFT_943301 [Mycena belliarum]|uniref:Uncharacterized protein n=1 Tax=Mycena belliarum TaxID=1033014 RepID=A0AAD6UH95_9AGAR|nr:hypothetical protein B0H15DRAFT_943301 [Mycena belliae]